MSNNNKSIIFYNGLREKSYCGYCKTDKSSYSYGMWASSLTVQAYQDMIDRGWRRSGKYCYKPKMETTCCPLYTIRCEALSFQPSKSQKKILKKVNKFLNSGEHDKNLVDIEQVEREPQMKYEPHDVFNHDDGIMQVNDPNKLCLEDQSLSVNCSENSYQLTSLRVTNKEDNDAVVLDDSNSKSNIKKKTKTFKPGKGADPNLPKSKKKKLLRIEKKFVKNPDSVITTSSPQQKSLEDFIAENDSASTDGVQKLRIKLLKLTPSSSTFEAEYAVYKCYQTNIHGDTDDRCTRQQFIRFLVDSPLRTEKVDHPGHPGYGSFHQQYWLDDKLIAVGVIDILPKCVSSVYLFYDPDYYHLVLGTYSSLREIHFVRHLYSMTPELKYYYIGYYIHTCPKMHYKAKISPSYLLCPRQYTWHAIDKCIQKLDNTKYSIFDESEYDSSKMALAIKKIPILYRGTLMEYSIYTKRSLKEEHETITEYATLVGPDLAKKLIYCILD